MGLEWSDKKKRESAESDYLFKYKDNIYNVPVASIQEKLETNFTKPFSEEACNFNKIFARPVSYINF